MNFDFPEEVRAMQTQAADYLVRSGSLEAARSVIDGNAEMAMRDWAEMAGMGWTGLTIAEDHGGNGIGHIALCAIAYEIGRHLSPTPFASSIYLVAEALSLFGSDAQRAKWLPGIADGSLAACFADAEGRRDGTGESRETHVANGELHGTKKPVSDGMVADLAIVTAVDGAAPGLYIADLRGQGVSRKAIATVEGLREHAEIVFDGAPADKLTDHPEALSRLFSRAAVLFAFEQVGGAQACLDMAVAFAKERYAFGRPIGSFQAIKHKLVDMFVAIELARSNAYFAAWALSTDASELPVASAAARLSASKAFWLAAKENVQTHGGIGFTWELDCHLYYRRHKALKLALGPIRAWEDWLIDGLQAGLVEL